AHKNNIKVFVYTVNFRYQLKKMIKLNVDGIFTNHPDLMYDYLKNYKI
ncbi:MAG: glycerophosphodiester phosphodiesterase, partial [Peptostreptococcaceae bacterium]